MSLSYNKQAGATAGATGAQAWQRLPWINERVAQLLMEGGGVLEDLHLRFLVLLQARYQQREIRLSDGEACDLLRCSESSVRRIRATLVRHRLIEWSEAGPDGKRRVAAPLAEQLSLSLSIDSATLIPGESARGNQAAGDSATLIPLGSARENHTPPPHPHPGSGASGMYTTPHDTARARAHASGPSGSDGGSESESLFSVFVGEARRRRRALVGVERVSDREYPKLRRLQQLGGTTADLDDALDEFRLRIEQKRAFLSGGSFGLVLDLAIDAVSAREETRYADQRTANDGRGDPPSAGGLARAPGSSGSARVSDRRAGSAQRAGPCPGGARRPSPISEEEERERERRNAEFVRKHLGAVARD